MTPHRLLFGYFHESAGYGLLALAVWVILSGLLARERASLDVPGHRLLVGRTGHRLHHPPAPRHGLGHLPGHLGPDSDLPGNRRRPIGLGVHWQDPGALPGE